MTDEQIVELYWQRSERAIPETESRYGAYCRTIAGNILGSPEDAEECVNDTWLCASIPQIAARHGFSDSKVKSMLHRTRLKLRKRAEEETGLNFSVLGLAAG